VSDAPPARSGVEAAEPFKPHEKPSLREIAGLFLFIGMVGFGGGMAIVALIEDTCVRKRRWMAPDEFAHGVAFGQFLGAFAVNTTTFVGYRMRGLAGAVVAVVAFLTPGTAIVIALSALYFRYQQTPALQSALHGIGPVVVAVLLSAAWRMGRPLAGARQGVVCCRFDAWASRFEPLAIAVASFALLYFHSAPVLAILAGVAAYGTLRVVLTDKGPVR
jgi:chromate transporter